MKRTSLPLRIRRREFITLLCGAAAWPLPALPEPSTRRPVVGWVGWTPQSGRAYIQSFLDGMRELGYVDGRDFDFVYRHPDGRADRLTQVAAEVVQLSPQVIIAPATTMAVPVRKVTRTIPIVVPALGDAIELGLIASDARPGGNVTGITPYLKGMPAKQLELAREVVPSARLVGLLYDAGDPKAPPQRLEIEAAAATAGVKIVTVEARTPADIGPAVEALAAARVQIAIVEQSTMLLVERKQIVDLVAARRLPTVYGYREQAEAGGLISYGVNLNWCFHRAAYYVDKILKGATPAELPVEFPTRLQLVINLKTAKALGIEIAPTLQESPETACVHHAAR